MCPGWQGVVRGQCYRARLQSNGIFCLVLLEHKSELKVCLNLIEKKKSRPIGASFVGGNIYKRLSPGDVFRNVVKVT